MAQRAERVEQPAAERRYAVVDGVDADPLEEPQADLDRGQVQVVDRAVLECAAPGASWWYSRWTNAATIVPPANHGRRSLASASRRASRQPTPVG